MPHRRARSRPRRRRRQGNSTLLTKVETRRGSYYFSDTVTTPIGTEAVNTATILASVGGGASGRFYQFVFSIDQMLLQMAYRDKIINMMRFYQEYKICRCKVRVVPFQSPAYPYVFNFGGVATPAATTPYSGAQSRYIMFPLRNGILNTNPYYDDGERNPGSVEDDWPSIFCNQKGKRYFRMDHAGQMIVRPYTAVGEQQNDGSLVASKYQPAGWESTRAFGSKSFNGQTPSFPLTAQHFGVGLGFPRMTNFNDSAAAQWPFELHVTYYLAFRKPIV